MSTPIEIYEGDWQERMSLIVEAMRQMSLHEDPAQMVAAYSSRMQGMMPADRFISLSRRKVEPPKYIIARDSAREAQIDPWSERDQLPMLEGGLFGELLYSNEPAIIDELSLDSADPCFEYVEGMRSLFAIPVFDRGEAMNMVVLLQTDPGKFRRDRAPEMVWTTNLFGRATHNLVLSAELKKAYEVVDQEMSVIADIQRSLLPATLPEIPGMDLAAHYQPAARAGGDYYDLFARPDGTWGLLMGDVSGHGSPAAVLMAVSHCLAHTQPNAGHSPGEVLRYVNDHLARLYTRDTGAFLTAFYGVYDPSTLTVTYAAAGHPPPIIRRCKDSSVIALDEAGGLPLGILQEAGYEEASIQLEQGDQLILYTDGITETFNRQRQMFGVDRLDEAVACCPGAAAGVVDSILAAVEKHSGGEPAVDDRTLLVATIL